MFKKVTISITLIVVIVMLAFQIYKFHLNHQGKFAETNVPTNVVEPSITVLNDNYRHREGISTDWGFSCIIRGMGKNILFDTASNGYILLNNMEKMDVSPQDVDAIVLSHPHNDHIRGLRNILEKNNNVEVYILKSFPTRIRDMITNMGAKVVNVDEKMSITDRISIMNITDGNPEEQVLTIKTDKGTILITGCSHYGIDNIIELAKKEYSEDVLLVMGGFHLAEVDRDKISKIATKTKEQKVRYVGPAHCSGELAMQVLEQEYADKFLKVGAGKIILIDELK